MTSKQQPRQFLYKPNDPAGEPALSVETDRLRETLRRQAPDEIAQRTGATYTAQDKGRGTLVVDLWGIPVVLDLPELIARNELNVPASLPIQALLMFYLTTSDGSAPVGEWVSFADLPGGRMYAQAFQGYSGNLLTKAFDANIQAFRRACTSAGGRRMEFADAAFAFTALPRIPLLVTYWLGEDEFPSASKVLFDPTAVRHLPIDVCAILGGMLVSRILKV
jgi:hypothetical protein